MTDDDVHDALRAVCAEVLHVDEAEVAADADLRADLKADSMDLAELAVEVERRFGPVMDRRAAADARTVGDVAALIRRGMDTAERAGTAG
ncbi:MAG TPA: acyl carrier protein [Thermomonospora sp.]|nr:acyl carrier protein [Thermomonospora sp.]